MLAVPANARVLQYLSPEAMPATTVCRRLYLPDDPVIIAAVMDVLAYLTLENVWIDTEDVPEYEIRAAMAEMLEDFAEDTCGE